MNCFFNYILILSSAGLFSFTNLFGTFAPSNSDKGLSTERALSQYHVSTWTSDQGLPTQGVNGIIQSDEGYIWLATYEGLFKFNGINFNNIIPEASNSKIAVNSFKGLYKEPCGKIWMIANGGGLISFHENTWNVYSTNDGLTSNVVNSFLFNSQNKLWIGTSRGAVVKNGERFEQVIIDESNKQIPINDILEDPKGNLWFATSNGLIKTDSSGKFLEKLTLNDGLYSDNVYSILIEPLNNDKFNVWIGTDKGVQLLLKLTGDSNESIKQDKLKSLGSADALSDKSIYKIYKDIPGNIWLGTNRGLFRYNGHLEEITENSRLPMHQVTDITSDDQGNIWVSTYRNGFYHIAQGKFITYSDAQGLAGKTVYGIIEAKEDSSIIIATDNGLSRYKKDWNFFPFEINGKPFLKGKDVRDLYQDSQGNYWFATTSKLYNYTYEQELNIYSTANGLISDYVRVIYEDRKGNLWFGTDEGLNKFNGGIFSEFTIENGLSSNRIHAVFEDSKGTIWVSTEDGLNKINGNKIESLFVEDGLSGNVIFKILEDNDGTIWVGTSGGISRIKNGKIDSIGRKEGLLINSVFDILEDKNGYFWIPTNQGIYRINKEELNQLADGKTLELDAVMYKKGDGMKVNACTANARSLISSFGEYWIPTPEGVTVIPQPESPEVNRNPPRIIIEAVQINGKDIPIEETMELPSGDYQLSIKYTGLDYHSPGRVSFSYSLSDYLKMPNKSDKREAVFTNIPPGEYTFNVIAFNSDNVPSNYSFQIIKKPKFTETFWFYLILAVIVVLIGRQIIIFTTTKVKRENKILEKKVEERTILINEQKELVEKKKKEVEAKNKALEESNDKLIKLNKEKNNLIGIVAHDLKSPLNHISGLINIIKLSGDNLNEEQDEYISHILKSANKLNQMISQILDIESIDSGKLKIQLADIEVQSLLANIISNYTVELERKEMKLHFEHKNEKFPIKADEKIVEQIFDNLISNAIKFTPNGKKVFIRIIETKAEYIRVEVQDEGPGIASADMHKLFGKYQKLSARPTGGEHSTGLGLSIVKKYVEALGGKVWCESESGNGATFIVELKKMSNKEFSIKEDHQLDN